MSTTQSLRLLRLPLILSAAFAASTASALEVLPLEIISNPYPDPSSVSATIAGAVLIGSDSDSSRLSGEGEIELGLAAAPFESARVTQLSLILDDGGSFSFLGGLLTASAEPGMTRVTMLEAGPAGTVTDGHFDQLGNLFRFEGEVSLSTMAEPLDLSTLAPVEADLEGMQLTDNGSQIEALLSFDLQFETSISLDFPAMEIPLTIDIAGSVLGVANKPLAPGDLDGNGVLDAADIDLLSQAVRDGSSDPLYDLNQDQHVDQLDRRKWVNELKYTYFGDANLNGEFTSSDMVHVFTPGKYETGQPAGWEDGDWDGDMVFGSSDMVAAFAAGGYEKGPRSKPQAVPEPSAFAIALMAIIQLGMRLRNPGKRECWPDPFTHAAGFVGMRHRLCCPSLPARLARPSGRR